MIELSTDWQLQCVVFMAKLKLLKIRFVCVREWNRWRIISFSTKIDASYVLYCIDCCWCYKCQYKRCLSKYSHTNITQPADSWWLYATGLASLFLCFTVLSVLTWHKFSEWDENILFERNEIFWKDIEFIFWDVFFYYANLIRISIKSINKDFSQELRRQFETLFYITFLKLYNLFFS